MPASDEAIYEVTFFVDDDAAARFDAWLDETLRETPTEEQVTDRRLLDRPAAADGRQVRILQYLLADDRSRRTCRRQEHNASPYSVASFADHDFSLRDRMRPRRP